MHLQALSHTQIQHDFLASTRDSIRPNVSVEPLDLSTSATLSITQSTEDLTGFSGTELEGCCALCLAASNGTAQSQSGVVELHVLGLEDKVLEPVVGGFDLAGHVCELHADDWMVNEALAEGLTLVCKLDRFFVADTSEADALDDDTHSLVVEVEHDD